GARPQVAVTVVDRLEHSGLAEESASHDLVQIDRVQIDDAGLGVELVSLDDALFGGVPVVDAVEDIGVAQSVTVDVAPSAAVTWLQDLHCCFEIVGSDPA